MRLKRIISVICMITLILTGIIIIPSPLAYAKGEDNSYMMTESTKGVDVSNIRLYCTWCSGVCSSCGSCGHYCSVTCFSAVAARN